MLLVVANFIKESVQIHTPVKNLLEDKTWRIIVIVKYVGENSLFSFAFGSEFRLPDELHLLGLFAPCEVVIVDSSENHLFKAHFCENRRNCC